MKALEQLIIQSRSRFRARRARAGREGLPARALLRLDDLDAPGAFPAPTLNAGGWHDVIVRLVEWSGALPVEVVARVDHPLLVDVVRFAHRLECPTAARTSTRGLDPRRAEALVDGGVGTVVLRVAGLTDLVQEAVLGEKVEDARRALDALLDARGSRGARLDVIVEVPLDARTAGGLPELCGAAKSWGVDGMRLAPPWTLAAPDAAVLDAIAWALRQGGRFHRTSPETLEALRKGAGGGVGCAKGATRIELLPDRTARTCPFVGAAVPVGESMADAWAGLAVHRASMRTCDRACAHPDLAS